MSRDQLPLSAPGPQPSLNRVVRLAGRPGEMRAVVEDDFHHFRVTLHHDGARVATLESASPRFPWSLCPAAGLELRALVGSALDKDMTGSFRIADARLQCTHQFDLAALAIANAARGTVTRRYDMVVPDTEDGRRHATLARDGTPLLDWALDGYAIAAPPPWSGRGLGGGFTAWVAESLDADMAEAALVLRRAIFISGGRGMAERLDRMAHAPDRGGCWVQQPEQAVKARREIGSTQDFTGRADMLTLDDEDWLAFAE